MKAQLFAAMMTMAVCGAGVASPPSPLYGLTWQERFAGTAIDTRKWNFRTDSKASSTQLPANVVVRDNQLSLLMKKEEVNGKPYTGAGIITKRLFGYGYYEVTARTTTNKGWHNSFWMMAGDGSDTYGPGHYLEIDQFEINTSKPDAVTSGLIFWNGQPGPKWIKEDRCQDVTRFDSSAAFHTYGADWREGAVDFYVDGIKYCTKAYQVDTYRQDPVRIWLTAIAYRDPVTVGGTPQLYRDVRFYQRDYYVLAGHDGYHESGAGWKTIAGGGFGLMPQRRSCGRGAVATFMPTIAQGGRYRLSVWNGGDAGDAGLSATIMTANGPQRRLLQPARNPGKWLELDVFRFRPGSSGQVALRAGRGCLNASAVKFVRVG